MTLEPLLFGALGLYALAMIAVSYFVGRETDYEEFAIADRNVGFIPMLGSMGSAFRDGTGIVFWVGTAVTTIYGSMWLIFGASIGFILFGLIAPYIRATAEEHEFITFGQMLRKVVGPKTRIFYATLALIFSTIYAVPQLWVIGHLMGGIADIPMWQSIAASTMLVGIYLIAGGYASVTITDAIQFFVIILLAGLPFVVDIPMDKLTDFGSLMDTPAPDVFALMVLGFAFTMFSGDFWQRIFSSRNDLVARSSLFAMPVVYVILTLGLIFVGLAASVNMDVTDANNAVFAIYESMALPVWILAIFGVIIVSICMSTLDTQLYLFTSTFIKDILQNRASEEYIPDSRLIMFVLLITAGGISFFVEDLIDYLFQSAAAFAVVTPLAIAAGLDLYMEKDRSKDIASIIAVVAGLIVWVGLFITGMFDQMIYLTVPIGVSTTALFIYLVIQKLRVQSGKNTSQSF